MNNLHNKIAHKISFDRLDDSIDRHLEFGIQIYFSRANAQTNYFKSLSGFIWAPVEDEMRKEYEATKE